MNYIIYRVSDFGNKENGGYPKPCDKVEKVYIDEVCYSEFYWQIQINTIEDLNNLIQEVGKIIIDNDVIYIYDDYIE